MGDEPLPGVRGKLTDSRIPIMCNLLGSMSPLSNTYKVRSCAKKRICRYKEQGTQPQPSLNSRIYHLFQVVTSDHREIQLVTPSLGLQGRNRYHSAPGGDNQRLKSGWTPRFSVTKYISERLGLYSRSAPISTAEIIVSEMLCDLFLSFLLCQHEALPFLPPRCRYSKPSTTPR